MNYVGTCLCYIGTSLYMIALNSAFCVKCAQVFAMRWEYMTHIMKVHWLYFRTKYGYRSFGVEINADQHQEVIGEANGTS